MFCLVDTFGADSSSLIWLPQVPVEIIKRKKSKIVCQTVCAYVVGFINEVVAAAAAAVADVADSAAQKCRPRISTN